jgi:hypothetical protein
MGWLFILGYTRWSVQVFFLTGEEGVFGFIHMFRIAPPAPIPLLDVRCRCFSSILYIQMELILPGSLLAQ